MLNKENIVGTYKKHYDSLTGQWFVFFVHDEKEDYICPFDDAGLAQAYCDQQNGEVVNVESE